MSFSASRVKSSLGLQRVRPLGYLYQLGTTCIHVETKPETIDGWPRSPDHKQGQDKGSSVYASHCAEQGLLLHLPTSFPYLLDPGTSRDVTHVYLPLLRGLTFTSFWFSSVRRNPMLTVADAPGLLTVLLSSPQPTAIDSLKEQR